MVIGAGVAGLATAWRLSRRGFRVTVLESTEHVGGRASGSWEQGFSMERTVQVLSHADRNLVEWINEVGLDGSLLPLRLVHLAQVHDGKVSSIDPTSRSGIARIPGMRTLDGLRLVRLPRLLRRYQGRLDPERPELAARWDDRSIADFARLYFGSSSLERWIGPEAMSQLLSDESETSRVAFLLQWITGSAGRARPGIPRAALHELPRSAADGLDVHLGVEAVRIEAASGGFEVHCRARRRGDGAVRADAVVVATPADVAERIA